MGRLGLLLIAWVLNGPVGPVGTRGPVAPDEKDAHRTGPANSSARPDRGRIAGTLTDEATAKPIAGATVGAVLIERRRRPVGATSAEAVTDADGRFVIGGLEPGVFNLNLVKVPGRDDAKARALEAIRVRPGAETRADMKALDGRPLRGVVRVHILHSTEQDAKPGALLGAYVVRYSDGSQDRIPIVYGKNVVNWWNWDIREEDPSDARIAWVGSNEYADTREGLKVRLYSIAWTNPHPEKEIAAIDMLSSTKACDPFLVAVTLEH